MAKRTDANHAAILNCLREMGFSVIDTHALPKFVDCVAGLKGYSILIEIKPPGKKLSKTQEDLFTNFDGWIEVIHDEDDCLRLKGEVMDLIEEHLNHDQYETIR